MNDIFSFYQLISKYQIEIPIIQRDYAQGRNNPKAEDVRKSMASSMIKSVTEDKSPLFFDFVYGRIDGNKFIPFDGQQRLTTLFLFHKYIFEKCQSCSACHYKSNCICNDILLRFTYATRQSSREFCEQLVSNSVIPSKEYHKKIRDEYLQTFKDKQEFESEIEKKTDEYVAGKRDWMSVFIKNQSWFYSDWEKDPTIMGMLTMLDEIHNQFTKKEINEYKPLAEKLTSGCSCPITYHFVDMGEHKLSDETYVKMNARGKTLTPFENFKASLEQYLEEKSKSKELSSELQKKHKDLLCRLNGGFDESLQKYTGIDGIWLDEFWNLVNKDKEIKEIPDSLMMSFFNRHFMNVWRCWYGNNTKSEKERKNLINEEIEKQKEYDSFNERIVAEMPLYPTKDDFVSWDIYQNVLENCDVDECLTPLFNICDALYKKNRIVYDCQAVWNRDNGKKQWSLYYGNKNNNNRETYPSRVAFYALLRYFGVKEERTTTTLAQWMRIVWNIIENSTIDSSDTYQAALRLINKLSGKCHNIHTALANDFESFKLGNQYHTEEQVAEEIAKAKQILDEDGNLRKYKGSCKKEDGSDYQTWKEIIIDAESYAFFKGSIRFLFTDGEGNINWRDFNVKWTNAQEYFDKDGVKDACKVELTKSLVVQCDDWEGQLYDKQIFNPKSSTWTWILTAKNWQTPIHNLLVVSSFDNITPVSTNNDKNIEEYITPILNNLPYKEMIETVPDGRFRWYKGRLGFYIRQSKAIIFDWDTWKRNELLHKLLQNHGALIKINSEHKISGVDLFWGWDINFEYSSYCFQWWRNYDDQNCDIYLMENDWKGYKKRPNSTTDKGTDEDKYYCFNVDATATPDSFIKELEGLIKQAESDPS